ncbi:MAG: TolC family protein, partial [Chthoniobacterales bacterium]
MKNSFAIRLSVLALFLCTASLFGAEENVKKATPVDSADYILDISLGDAIQMALAKNFDIQIQQYDPKIAKAQQLSASGKFDPTLQVSYTYDSNRQELRSLASKVNNEITDPNSPLYARREGQLFDANLSGILPPGTTYSLGPSLSVSGDSTREPNFNSFDTFTGFEVTQPVLQNFGTDVNLAGIRIARANQSISEWQFRQILIDTITDTINAYNELYFSIQNLDVEQRYRQLAQQLVIDNQKRAEIGVMSPLDVVQAQADLASREERLLVAQRSVLDNQNFLKQLITDDVAGFLNILIRISPPPSTVGYEPNLNRDLPVAFDIRPDYRQSIIDIQKRNINLVFTRNQVLPRLDLVGSLGLNGLDSNLGDSISGVGQNNFAWSVGAIFSVPIPNRSARGETQVAQLEIAQALVALKQLEQSIIVEVDNAAGQIDTTRKRIEASRVAREFAQQTLEAGQARLASGTTTTFEVLQFQRDLAQARIAEIRALVEYNKAIAEYARKTGTTLDL